ncbi:MAG: site-specific integrase, partial [Candidatus Electrothrix sp.]
MTQYNPDNERIKREYLTFLKEAKQHSEPTLDAATKALHRFETYSGFRDFKRFHFEQAIAFKKHFAKQKGERSSKPLSKSTMHSTLSQLKRFFEWLSQQTGYKSRIQYT